jgi:hypothetical protein
VLYPDLSGPVPEAVPQMKAARTRYYSASRVWWMFLFLESRFIVVPTRCAKALEGSSRKWRPRLAVV